MKKRILSVLLGCSLLFGTVFANAVSIEFEDLEQNDRSEEQSMIEEVIIDENSISLEATNEIINVDEISSAEIILNEYDNIATNDKFESNSIPLSDVDSTTSLDATSLIGYFTNADNITYTGNTSMGYNSGFVNTGQYAIYSNTLPDNSKYVKYSNAVKAGDKKYDLIVYPFMVTQQAGIYVQMPGFNALGNGHGGYKLVITEHNNISKPVKMTVMMGSSDLDDGEYVIMPLDFSEVHRSIYLEKENASSVSGIKYVGNRNVIYDDGMYNTNCVFGILTIQTSGTTVFYGCTNGMVGSLISFDSIKNYIENNAYTIQFDANGGSGSIPSSVIKYGNNITTILGNIGDTVPIKEGYTFKGWSATPTFNNKRIAYSSGNTGATQTSNSWTYADYCNYTGGDSSNRTLTLYAQWEANSYTVTINKGNLIVERVRALCRIFMHWQRIYICLIRTF